MMYSSRSREDPYTCYPCTYDKACLGHLATLDSFGSIQLRQKRKKTLNTAGSDNANRLHDSNDRIPRPDNSTVISHSRKPSPPAYPARDALPLPLLVPETSTRLCLC
jgi:hypothetical protein